MAYPPTPEQVERLLDLRIADPLGLGPERVIPSGYAGGRAYIGVRWQPPVRTEVLAIEAESDPSRPGRYSITTPREEPTVMELTLPDGRVILAVGFVLETDTPCLLCHVRADVVVLGELARSLRPAEQIAAESAAMRLSVEQP